VTTFELDDLDRRLLDLLQADARYTAIELAERLGVSDNTIHNRMERLEDVGVVEGYRAVVDHERAGFDLTFTFTCTTRINRRSDIAEQILGIPEVIAVTELMTGQQNVIVRAVGREDSDITGVAEQVDELDVEINDENLVREIRTDPLGYAQIGPPPDDD